MTSHQVVISEINDILNTFRFYINTYENDITKSSIDDIKNNFKAALFVEKTITKMEEKSLLSQFTLCLNSWLQNSERSQLYNANFFRIACDHLLKKYFNTKHFEIEIALRIYTSSCSEERFEHFIQNLIIESYTNNAILNYSVLNKAEINLPELESQLVLLNWKNDIEIGKYEEVKNYIADTLESYRIDKHLPIFINILVLDNLSDQESSIKSLLLKLLLNKMNDRSSLSKEFWLTLVKNIDRNLLVQVCINNRLFLTSLLNFLIYCGCMMNYDSCEVARAWTSSADRSICPEVTFDDITCIIKILMNTKGGTEKYVKSHIEKSLHETKSLFWVDVATLCL